MNNFFNNYDNILLFKVYYTTSTNNYTVSYNVATATYTTLAGNGTTPYTGDTLVNANSYSLVSPQQIFYASGEVSLFS